MFGDLIKSLVNIYSYFYLRSQFSGNHEVFIVIFIQYFLYWTLSPVHMLSIRYTAGLHGQVHRYSQRTRSLCSVGWGWLLILIMLKTCPFFRSLIVIPCFAI